MTDSIKDYLEEQKQSYLTIIEDSKTDPDDTAYTLLDNAVRALSSSHVLATINLLLKQLDKCDGDLYLFAGLVLERAADRHTQLALTFADPHFEISRAAAREESRIFRELGRQIMRTPHKGGVRWR